MAVYVEPPRSGVWFGKKQRMVTERGEGQGAMDVLLRRLDACIDRIENHGELDDEMRHTLLRQAFTYEEFATEVRDGQQDIKDPQVVVAIGSVKSFCKLIETEL